MFKRFVVTPPSMIWPQTLLTAVLFNTLHGQETSGNQARSGISRLRFFYYVSIGYFFYSKFFLLLKQTFMLLFQLIIFPRLLPVLSLHRSLEFLVGLLDSSKQCQGQPALWCHPWFVHGRSHLRLGSNHLHRVPFYVPLVGCGTHGRRCRIFLLDPRSHSLRKSALLIPFAVFFFLFMKSRLLQYTNVWYSAYLPLVSSVAFDNRGKQYNVSRIINSDASFNLQAYKTYSPIFLSASFAISYGLSFATVTAAISHTFLYYRKYIWAHARRPLSQKPDIHARLMSVYKEVPVWWYLAIFSLSHRLFILKNVC